MTRGWGSGPSTPELGFPLDKISSPSLLSAVSPSGGFQLNSVHAVTRSYCLAGPLLPFAGKRKPPTPRPQSPQRGDHGGEGREQSQEGEPSSTLYAACDCGSRAQMLEATGQAHGFKSKQITHKLFHQLLQLLCASTIEGFVLPPWLPLSFTISSKCPSRKPDIHLLQMPKLCRSKINRQTTPEFPSEGVASRAFKSRYFI